MTARRRALMLAILRDRPHCSRGGRRCPDLLLTAVPIEAVGEHLRRSGVSIYFYDPDGNLVEVANSAGTNS